MTYHNLRPWQTHVRTRVDGRQVLLAGLGGRVSERRADGAPPGAPAAARGKARHCLAVAYQARRRPQRVHGRVFACKQESVTSTQRRKITPAENLYISLQSV